MNPRHSRFEMKHRLKEMPKIQGQLVPLTIVLNLVDYKPKTRAESVFAIRNCFARKFRHADIDIKTNYRSVA